VRGRCPVAQSVHQQVEQATRLIALRWLAGHEDCNEAELNQPGSRRGVAAYALDPEAAARLWQVSAEMLAAVSTVTG
jgi:hypothetical protein